MFEKKFINKNIKKFFLNLKKKNYFLNKRLFGFFIKIKKFFLIKNIFFYKIKKTNKKIKKKKYFLKLKKIYKNYFKKINKNFKIFILKIPNFTHYLLSNKNKIIKKTKYKKKIFKNFKKKVFNFKISNNICGKGFFYISGPLSIFYKILENQIINLHIKEHNYKYIVVPNIIKFKSLINSGQIPKFIKKMFIIKNKNKIKYLIPTSEVSLVNFLSKKVFNSKYLPVKFITNTECYRNEKFFYGKINKKFLRRKQFTKIELLKIINEKNSYNYLRELIKNVEKIVKNFNINYRIIMLSKKEVCYNSSITYDIEVWMPSMNNYVEISSCSNTETYQSVRSKIKYVNMNKKYVNVINGSGPALGRFFLSILENYKINKNILKIPTVIKNIIKKNFLKI